MNSLGYIHGTAVFPIFQCWQYQIQLFYTIVIYTYKEGFFFYFFFFNQEFLIFILIPFGQNILKRKLKCLHVQFCLSGLDETLQEVGHSRKADIRVSRLQDIRTSRCPVHHRSLHKLCNRYVATVRQTTGSLGQKGRGSSVSAGWLSHVRSNTHLELSIVLCVQGIFALNYHTKKKYQLFSYWFLLNSCEWRYSVNYIRFFFSVFHPWRVFYLSCWFMSCLNRWDYHETVCVYPTQLD